MWYDLSMVRIVERRAEVCITVAVRAVRPPKPRKVRCIRATAYCPQLPARLGGLSREEETDEKAEVC